jgi:hypothetical protein
MAVEVKTHPSHPKSMSQRVANRLRNSGDGAMPDEHAVHGSGPTRTHTNIHHAGHYTQPGTAAKPTDGDVANNPSAKSQGGTGVG